MWFQFGLGFFLTSNKRVLEKGSMKLSLVVLQTCEEYIILFVIYIE